jgi:uncharacterized protein YkwD
MNIRNRLLTVTGFLFILILLFTASFHGESTAQDEGIIPHGLGEPPTMQRTINMRPFQEQVVDGPLISRGEFLTYIPLLANPIANPTACSLNAQEQAVASLAINHPDQGRKTLDCHPILARVARERALDMGKRGYFSHTNPDGYGPNYLVRQAGYQLPSWWSSEPTTNYIESIAGGYPTPEAAWQAWLNSPGHRRHVLGENEFWAEQTNYGIGYAYVAGSPYRHYWVFITAPPEGN